MAWARSPGRGARVSKAYGADGHYRHPGSLPVCLPGRLNCTVASLASFRDGLIERGLESLVGVVQRRMLVARCGDTTVGWGQDAGRGHGLSV
jgi:hypothetical protein